MVLCLLSQPEIFSQLYLIELLGLLIGMGLLKMWHLIYPMLLAGFGMLVFFTNLSVMEFQIRYFTLFLLNRQFQLVLDKKSSQEYPVNAGDPQVSILGPKLFPLYLPDDVTCDIPIYSDDTTLYSKCDQASSMWQQPELASEVKSDLQDTVEWGKKWVDGFNAEKMQLVSFDWSNNNGSIGVKIDGSLSS